MKLKSLGANQTEIDIDGGMKVLFSYETPVAAFDAKTGRAFRTTAKWSTTTTRHIDKWIGDNPQVSYMAQDWFHRIVAASEPMHA